MRRVLIALLLVGCGSPAAPPAPTLGVDAVLGGDPGDFARALVPRPFGFPADHGPHPEFRNEWWYVTGNLESATGRRFGVQLTIFRAALRQVEPRESAWAPDALYMAHAAVGDIGARRFVSLERFARGALGLAGARAEPFAVWLEDWSLAAADQGAALGPAGLPPLRLRVRDERIELDLRLVAPEAPVLHGDRGLSAKGSLPGSASYYYSLTRIPTEGTLRVGDERHQVRGDSWLDREWSSAALEPGLRGWDWFSLQLDDDSEIMLYVLRDEGGPAARSGTWVPATGAATGLASDAIDLRVTDHWDSPRGGRYPAAWELRIPSLELALSIQPLLSDQEMTLSFRYWEGAVEVTGRRGGVAVDGLGFVELTGYDGSLGR